MAVMPLKEIPKKVEKELSEYGPLTQRLLFNRGILTKEEAHEFMNPSYEDHVYDPFLMFRLEEAVDRIYKAVKEEEKISIFADYDCDGIPGAVVMNDFFHLIKYENFEIYIPDRHKEGYGLNRTALEDIRNRGGSLVITVDLGITAVEDVEFAKGLGLEVIVTDHHLPKDVIPDTLVVNPKQPGDTYPDNMLCGAGVAFKVVQGFIKKYGEEFGVKESAVKWMLDMVGLATLADMVPLRHENRALAYYGLKVLRQTRRPGLLQLFRRVNLDARHLQEDDLTFSICPKLNAASRMDSPMRAFELLSANDEGVAGLHAMNLTKMNDERKTLVATMMRSVKKTFGGGERLERSVIVIGDPTWRAGVLGLVAGKIVDEFKKPAFVWGLEGGTVIKGSCRSDGTVNLVDMMKCLPENSLLEFGGHAGAGGFSVSHEEIHFLEERLADAYEKTKTLKIDSPEDLEYDTELALHEINDRTWNEIEKMAPFGAGNPKPTFMLRDIEVADIKIFGKAKDHLELSFLDSNERRVKAINFFKSPADYGEKLKVGGKINLLATIEKSVFGYKKEIRLRIVGIS